MARSGMTQGSGRCLDFELQGRWRTFRPNLTALGLKVDTHTGVSRFARRWIRCRTCAVTQAFRMPHRGDRWQPPNVELVTEANGDRVVVRAMDKVNRHQGAVQIDGEPAARLLFSAGWEGKAVYTGRTKSQFAVSKSTSCLVLEEAAAIEYHRRPWEATCRSRMSKPVFTARSFENGYPSWSRFFICSADDLQGDPAGACSGGDPERRRSCIASMKFGASSNELTLQIILEVLGEAIKTGARGAGSDRFV